MPQPRRPAAITFVIPGELVAGTHSWEAADVTAGAASSATGGAGGAATRAAARFDAPAGTASGAALGLRGRVKAAVRVGIRRDGGRLERVQAVPGEDVVVLHLAGGPALVLHPESARDLLRAQGDRRRDAPAGLSGDARAARAGASGAAPATRAGAAGGSTGEPAADAEVVEVPAELRWSDLEAGAVATRGAPRGFLGDVLLSLVEVISGPAEDLAQDWVASRIGARVDDQVVEGVYALDAEHLPPLKGCTPVAGTMPPAPDGGPTLVFVHGTFSTTESGFGKLWQTQTHRVRALFRHYRDAVYALDHATLRRSPIENALTLVQATPPGARLHLLTHSRGGLVAEVLARAAALDGLDEAARELFTLENLPASFTRELDAAGRAEVRRALDTQKAALERLIGELRARRITIERIVRVACPARGTLLASQRLDAYLSILQWAMGLAQVPVAPAFVDFLAGVAQRRADPRLLPGLAAMVPDSPLIRWLHAAEAPVDGQLRVVAGDLEGDSIGSWLKTLVTDAFYWTDHDLVVQTRSMYGGVPRRAGASFVLDRGGKVTHFNYFGNDTTASAVVAALTQDQPAGYRLIGPLSQAGESASGARAARREAADDGRVAADKPAVFVLPGILGSHLKVDDRRIWLGWRLVNGLARLAYPDDTRRVQPDGAIGLIYEDLMDVLAKTHQVIEFAFDWRRPLEDEARRLGDAVLGQLVARERSGQPVRIVAHSMGGLLARTMQLECPEVWSRLMAHPKARLLMLGTPNDGSWAPMQCLSGDDGFGNTLAAFGAPFQDHAARQLMACFPGFLQLQAGLRRDDPRGLCREATWRSIADEDVRRLEAANAWHRDERQLAIYRWGVPPQAVLDQAVALRERLDAQRDHELPRWSDRLALVLGHARSTPDGFELGAEGLVYLDASEAGDGRVPHANALLPGVRTWQIPVEHGSLPDASEYFDAFLELLEQGTTAKLKSVPAAGATRGGEPPREPAVAHTRSRPSRDRSGAAPPPDIELRHPLLLPRAEAPRGAETAALRVSVHNGDLSFVRQPLMLGHYRTTHLTGTERVVDELIGGTMKDSLDLRQYPDAAGTHQFFANAGGNRANPFGAPRPESVIVVGLGTEGNLRPSELSYTVRMGVLALAQRRHEQPAHDEPGFELAATLLGSGGAGITVGTAAQCIAQGVREADQALAELNTRLEAVETGRGGRGQVLAPGRAVRRWPRVRHLLLVELYLDRAAEAWRALKLQAESTPGAYALADRLSFGPGALRRPLDGGYRGTSYDYIRALGASGPKGEALVEYTVDTRKRARTEQIRQPVQERLLRSLVAEASNERSRDEPIGRTLFNLLVPVELGPFLGGTSEMLLQLDPGTAAIPWELLDTEGGSPGATAVQPWAVRAKLVRTLTTVDHRRQVVDASPDAHVLVIGEPLADPKAFPALPGARAEARAVRRLLRRDGGLPPDHVLSLVADDDRAPGPDARAVINALMARAWRIVHIAGHGMPPDGEDPRGVVLSDGTFLGPHEIQSMRVVPELVFVNCCHLAGRHSDQVLATQRYDRVRFAAGVAEKLIEIGVRCVVAAGWAVDDAAAESFATTFYQALLRGERFIDAAAQAREAARQHGGHTWAAYQCYGDPDWILKRAGSDPQAPAASLDDEYASVTSPPALALALETIHVECRHQGRNRESRRAKIRHLETRFTEAWGRIGAVAEAFGLAWDAAGDRDAAIRWYRRAMAAGDGSASLKATEQLADLLARQAQERIAAMRPRPDAKAVAAALAAIGEARGLLERLIALAPSLERWSLVGSTYQRAIRVARAARGDSGPEAVAADPGDERVGEPGDAAVAGSDAARDDEQALLVRMAEAYHRALEEGRRSNAPDLFDPALNHLSALAAQVRDRPLTLDPAELALTRQLLIARNHDDPDFRTVIGLTTLDLCEAVASLTLHERLDRIVEDYEALYQRTQDSPNWGPERDRLEFVLHGVRRWGRPKEKAAAGRVVKLMRRSGPR